FFTAVNGCKRLIHWIFCGPCCHRNRPLQCASMRMSRRSEVASGGRDRPKTRDRDRGQNGSLNEMPNASMRPSPVSVSVCEERVSSTEFVEKVKSALVVLSD